MSLRVRVTMDGDKIGGTHLYDADTGKELDPRQIHSVVVSHRAGTLPRIRVEFLGGPVDVVGQLESDEQQIARRYLSRLGHEHHPSADRDPVGALGQVAIDLATHISLLRRGSET